MQRPTQTVRLLYLQTASHGRTWYRYLLKKFASSSRGFWKHSQRKARPGLPGHRRGVWCLQEVELSDYRGKCMILSFYLLDFTFLCPTEMIVFSEPAEDFRKLGREVLGVSVDSQLTRLAWINTPRKEGGLGPLTIPLLAHVMRNLSHDCDVLKKDEGIAYRGLFIIKGKGVLHQIAISDLPVGRCMDAALQLVQAFQYTDEHGEVCPTGWKPGSDTVKPNVDDSKEYFSKHN